MRAGTVITVISIPVYWLLHARFGVIGLAWASNIAILVHTLTLAILLHRRRMVSLAGLNRPELGKSVLASLVSFAAVALLLRVLPHAASQTYRGDLVSLSAGSVVWATAAFLTLWATGSKLPQQILRR
jgi:putative peptidoglycan lipid II flippase